MSVPIAHRMDGIRPDCPRYRPPCHLARHVGPVAELRTVIASAVRSERERLGWTQQQLALELGWTRSVVTKLEAGTRALPVDELPRLCATLGVTLDRLMLAASSTDRQAIGLD
jgi:ribosome-binding protein aMBF1 (putative translation factor)